MSADPQGGTKVKATTDGVVVERYFGYRYADGRFYGGDPDQPMYEVDSASPILSGRWALEYLVLITRTTTPGAPTLEAVPLREGDVLQGPYVLKLAGDSYWNGATRHGWGATIEEASQYLTLNAAGIAGGTVTSIHRLLSRPGAPEVTYTVQPLAEVCGVTP